jgi:hypothetical protein
MNNGHDIDFREEEVFEIYNIKTRETRPPTLIVMPFYMEKIVGQQIDFIVFFQS